MDFWHNTGMLVGRILLSAVFLWAGTAKILNWEGTISEKTFFMKDMAILGGLILLCILGSGQYSIDVLQKNP